MNNPTGMLFNPSKQASETRTKIPHQGLVAVALAAIISINVLASLYWVEQNTVLIGNDASGYLGTTLEYARRFTNLSPATLFQAFTYPEYRTPGLFMAVQPFYWLFGVDMDSAQLINILALAGLVVAVYALGAYAAGPGVGLMSALLVGLLPMIMAMARLFYTELPLTLLVVLALLTLAKSAGFQHRGWTIAWGVSLGIGLLVKWALPLYVLLPTLWVIWQSRLLQEQVASLRHLQIRWRALGLATLAGLGLTLLWCWPNRAELPRFLLGNGLAVAWFVLFTLWLYALQLPRSRLSNWWAGILTAVVLASPWYLPYIDFAARLANAEQTRGDAGATALSIYNYVRYFAFFYSFHLGALATWVIVPTALFPWLRSLWTRRPIAARSRLLWFSVLSTYLVLLLLSQSSPRFLVPILPSLVILAAIGLWQYRGWRRVTVGTTWVAVLLLQWSLFTFDALTPIYARSEPLWTVRGYAIQPRSNETDLAYWIGPDVLDQVTATGSQEAQQLGVLVNMPQLHRGILKYIVSIEARPVEIMTLTEDDADGWLRLLASQWLLVKDGNNRDVDTPGLALIARVLGNDPLVRALFRVVKQYPLPNGETVYLYQRTLGPGRPLDLPLQLAQTQTIADAIAQAWSRHATLLYADPDMAVWVGAHDPTAPDSTGLALTPQDVDKARVYVLPGDAQFDPASIAALEDTLLVVWDAGAHNLFAWLNEHAYRATEVGDDFAAVAIYGRPTAPLVATGAGATWPQAALEPVHTYATVRRGQVLPIETTITGRDNGPVAGELKLSLRLLAADGAVVASNDRMLAARDRLGLFVPPNAAPGAYTLAAVLYDPTTGAVFPDRTGATPTTLATIEIVE